MTELQIKQKLFLNETVAHFNLTNRSYDEKSYLCLYAGIGCAIGRKIDDKQLCAEFDSLCDNQIDSSVNNNTVFFKLPKELQELGQDFLYTIQKLHDDAGNWSINGISEYGLMNYNSIVDKYLS